MVVVAVGAAAGVAVGERVGAAEVGVAEVAVALHPCWSRGVVPGPTEAMVETAAPVETGVMAAPVVTREQAEGTVEETFPGPVEGPAWS